MAASKGHSKQKVLSKLDFGISGNSMFAEGSESFLTSLRGDLNDADKWLSVARMQPSPQTQIEILSRAVATSPSSLSLWQELVTLKVNNQDSQNLPEILRDAVGLFPDNCAFWLLMFDVLPSVETFTTALRNIDNALVWPRFIEFLMHCEITSNERLTYCQNYLVQYPQQPQKIIQSLVEAEQFETAAKLLLEHVGCSPEVWMSVVHCNKDNQLLIERALELFPKHDGDLVPLLAQQKLETAGFHDARSLVLNRLENASSAVSFCALFSFITRLYEQTIDRSMREVGQGGWKTAQLLTELGNIVRKRPLLLSKIALSESPNNVGLWLDRAKLWQTRPHMAADVIETALKTANPYAAYNGDITDLHIRYAQLQIQNGNNVADACRALEDTLAHRSSTPEVKTKLCIALADIYQGPENNASKALKIIKATLEKLPGNKMLWMHYLSVLAETKSPDLMEVFSSCCTRRVVTMRMVLMTARAYPDGSSDQIAVYEKGVSMFPPQISLSLWRHYLSTASDLLSIYQMRGAFSRAFEAFNNFNKSREELALLYLMAERAHSDGSLIMARSALQRVMPRSKNFELWLAYIATYEGDVSAQRQAYETAIDCLDDKEAHLMTLKMAAFEENLGEIQRSQLLLQYASKLQDTSQSQAAWKAFEERHSYSDMGHNAIRFIPAMEMES